MRRIPSPLDARVSGTEFNRIRGPGRAAGPKSMAFLIARVRTDINLAEIRAAVVDLLGDVEKRVLGSVFSRTANLEAKIAAT